MPAHLCSAYLRVYAPLASLGDAERDALLRATAGDPPWPARACASSSEMWLLPPDERAEAFTRTVDGESYVCPSFPRLRALECVASPREAPSDHLVRWDDVELAASELRRVRAAFPGLRAYLRQSVWHVPHRWFVCFEDAERRLEQHGDHPTVRYETTMTTALGRLDTALKVLGSGIKHPAMIAGTVVELARWLRTFPEDSLLELDYASVAELFDGDELADDHSASDMWARIHALGDGDGARAAAYQRCLDGRWAPWRHLELTN